MSNPTRARLNNIPQFFHHVRHIKKEIDCLSAGISRIEVESPGLDQWITFGYPAPSPVQKGGE